MADPSYPAFPVFAFLGFFLSLVPLPWHFQAWNSGTCYYMMWAALSCLNQFVNSVVWAENALNPAPIWCDISTRIIIGASVGIPAASLSINRRLYIIATMQTVSVTKADKRRAVLIDTLICVLFPVVVIVLSYIVQGHRFNILEEIGCSPAIYNTVPAYFLVDWWPIVLGLVSAVYCILSLCAFAKRRAQINELLHSKNSSLTFGRYFRLMALATTELTFTLPISIFSIWLNATAQPVEPWRGWSDTHFGFSRVDQIPSIEWRANHEFVVAQELSRWLNPACAFIFFAYFGFASEAARNYRMAFSFVAARLGLSPESKKSKDTQSNTIDLHHKTELNPPILPTYTTPTFASSMEKVALSSASSVSSTEEKAIGVDVENANHLSTQERGRPLLSPASSSMMYSPVDSTFRASSSISISELESMYGSTLGALIASEPPTPSVCPVHPSSPRD